MKHRPSYQHALKSGYLEEISHILTSRLGSCDLCPRKCHIDRLAEQKGFCRTGKNPIVYSYLAHFGEEPPISGTKGSGTIFFSNCNMGCVYCQNWQFSQASGQGEEMTAGELAEVMLRLQNQGCHNINLVTPTHVLAQILQALQIAASKGLQIPIVYNTSGYELPEIINKLKGIIDIYLSDIRYSDDKNALEYSKAGDYVSNCFASVKEMYTQVGNLDMDKDDLACKGLIIRHLVLPNNISGSKEVMRFLAEKISQDVFISLMSQYHPYHKAREYPQINRMIKDIEYKEALDIMHSYGLYNGWTQEYNGRDELAGINIKPIKKTDDRQVG